MQRNVVEDAVHSGGLERVDECVALRQRGQQQVVHVRIVQAVRGHHRAAQSSFAFQRRGPGVVLIPQRQAARGDVVGRCHLCGQEGGGDLARQIGRADVHPSVLVHLAAKEPAAVGAFLADDLRSFGEIAVTTEQGATLAANDVLGFVEA